MCWVTDESLVVVGILLACPLYAVFCQILNVEGCTSMLGHCWDISAGALNVRHVVFLERGGVWLRGRLFMLVFKCFFGAHCSPPTMVETA